MVVIGYISTAYGARPVEKVEADIARWIRFYPAIKGFFFDEQASGIDQVAHYQTIYSQARRRLSDARIVANPGVVCAPEYLSIARADTLCIYENSGGFEKFAPAPWMKSWNPSRFAVLLHSVAKANAMQSNAKKAARDGVGFFFGTDDSGDNPWDALPAYWKEEVESVRAIGKQKR